MEIVVAMDGDGHFKSARLGSKYRDHVLDVLKSVSDGDYFANTKDENDFPENYNSLSDEEWEKLIKKFTQRGTFEIIDLI